MSGRRGKDDVDWQELRKRVHRRDRDICRLLRIMTARDAAVFFQKAPKRQQTNLQCAHAVPVGARVDLCYCDDNVVLLNEFSHSCLDNMLHPITGEPITRQERDSWWVKILGPKQFSRLVQANKGINPFDVE